MADVVLPSVSLRDGMWNSSHALKNRNSTVSFAIASNSTTASHAKGTLISQGPSSYWIASSVGVPQSAFPVGTESPGATATAVYGPEMATPVTELIHPHADPIKNDEPAAISPSSSAILASSAGIAADIANSMQPLPNVPKTLSPSMDAHSSLISSTQTANQASPLTISGQTVTANTLGQYSINNEILTPGGVITVSGSKISLAPNASDLIIGTSTEALYPTVSAHPGSGPKGTEVQKFTGHALGATDGLWSSSMMLLISFLLMLWI